MISDASKHFDDFSWNHHIGWLGTGSEVLRRLYCRNCRFWCCANRCTPFHCCMEAAKNVLLYLLCLCRSMSIMQSEIRAAFFITKTNFLTLQGLCSSSLVPRLGVQRSRKNPSCLWRTSCKVFARQLTKIILFSFWVSKVSNSFGFSAHDSMIRKRIHQQWVFKQETKRHERCTMTSTWNPENTHRGARTHDHKIKSLALYRLS